MSQETHTHSDLEPQALGQASAGSPGRSGSADGLLPPTAVTEPVPQGGEGGRLGHPSLFL